MVDAWLIIVTIVIGLLMLAINIYLFAIYCHPDDLTFGAGWFAKIVVILGSAVVWSFVLVLPLDVANSRGAGGGFNMDLFYMIMFILYFVFLIFIVPFTLHFYETDEDKSFISRLCYAFCLEIFTLIIVAVLALIAWGAMREAELHDMITAKTSGLMPAELTSGTITQTVLDNRVIYQVPPYLFMIVFLIFIGWFLFVVFAGIGITALPMDWILDYFYRPQPRSPHEMAERKVALRRRAEELMKFAQGIQTDAEEKEDDEEKKGFFKRWKEKRQIQGKEKKLTAELYKLEQEFEIWEVENSLSANPIWPALKLAAGIFFAIISFVILLHALVFVIIKVNGKPASEMLNKVFIWLEFSVARFISTILFAALTIYMLFCVIKGNIKFGLRLFFVMKIHPMKVRGTYMNSFLFNLSMILLCVPPIIHFQIEMFKVYMNMTSGAFLFTTLLTRMKFFKWFYESKFFFYAFLVWSLLTFIYLACKPKSDRLDIKKFIESRKKA
jgi:LMBR1 domain-containing protein 1